MLLRSVVFSAAVFLLVIFFCSCGSDNTGAKGEFQLCRDYCELQKACRSGDFDEQYVQECQDVCDTGVYDNEELDMNDLLIRCGKYDADCEVFMQCYDNGGSLTDDIYGYQEQ